MFSFGFYSSETYLVFCSLGFSIFTRFRRENLSFSRFVRGKSMEYGWCIALFETMESQHKYVLIMNDFVLDEIDWIHCHIWFFLSVYTEYRCVRQLLMESCKKWAESWKSEIDTLTIINAKGTFPFVTKREIAWIVAGTMSLPGLAAVNKTGWPIVVNIVIKLIYLTCLLFFLS